LKFYLKYRRVFIYL